jgi:hypothetical protein
MVFCPKPEFAAEAEELSRKEMLPILMGLSHRTQGMILDDSRVSVVSVPDTHSVTMESPFTIAGLVQAVNYSNDYRNLLADDTRMVVIRPDGTNDEIQPAVREEHFCRFLVRTTVPGEYNAEIMCGEDSVFFTRFEAKP